ncbi:hypothetical protein [Mesorhizobium sp.]|uniref:hypothetical protein n=1 Tax=Mesorhizobium sp. TaxID=1871066 RepID=UPI0025BDE56A|nr:hypothetical protein [Mesorhizobium sp.]
MAAGLKFLGDYEAVCFDRRCFRLHCWLRDATGQNSRRAECWPCTQADKERLATLTNQQNEAANGEALGVFLIGVPVASMSGGDRETEIAVLKGRCGPPKT